jgi:hypothetical protein
VQRAGVISARGLSFLEATFSNVEFSGVDPTQRNLNPCRRRLPENLFDLVCVYSF